MVALLECNTNNMTELPALIQGLIFCKDLGIDKLKVEGDPTFVVNAIRIGDTQSRNCLH